MGMKIKTIGTSEIKVRRNWGSLSPVTRIVTSKKSYSRKEKFRKLFD